VRIYCDEPWLLKLAGARTLSTELLDEPPTRIKCDDCPLLIVGDEQSTRRAQCRTHYSAETVVGAV
jgi:hypothetical protein